MDLRSALRDEAARAGHMPHSLPEIHSRSLRRRVLNAVALTIGSAALVAGAVTLIGTVGETSVNNDSTLPPAGSTPGDNGVPDVEGMQEPEAITKLARNGYAFIVENDNSRQATGAVTRTEPGAGSQLPQGATVTVVIAGPPGPSTDEFGDESPFSGLGQLIEHHPDVFVGMSRGYDGTPVIVFNPGIDRADWEARLDEASGAIEYRTSSCSVTRAALESLQDELAELEWARGRRDISFTAYVDAVTCSVRVVSGELSRDDVALLYSRFENMISIDTGSTPARY